MFSFLYNQRTLSCVNTMLLTGRTCALCGHKGQCKRRQSATSIRFGNRENRIQGLDCGNQSHERHTYSPSLVWRICSWAKKCPGRMPILASTSRTPSPTATRELSRLWYQSTRALQAEYRRKFPDRFGTDPANCGIADCPHHTSTTESTRLSPPLVIIPAMFRHQCRPIESTGTLF
jgi:hypothetical protein